MIMEFKPGIYEISNEAYHASPGISRSALIDFMKSPLHYWDKHINPDKPKKKSSEAHEFGNALHAYILEPEKFEKKYLIFEKKDGRTTEGKNYNAESFAIAKSTNRSLLSEDNFREIINIFNAIKKHPTALELINGAKYEQSIYWHDEETGLLCKARPDIMFANMVSDIKTTLSAEVRSFEFSIRDYGYHIQAAMIQDAIKYTLKKDIFDFVFIALEKERPYAIGTYPLAERAIEEGKKQYKNALIDIKKCIESNIWPSYPTTEVSLPYLK